MWMVTSWRDFPAGLAGRTERELLAWFSRNVRAGETWLDIGGHYGYTAFALGRLVGSTGRVFSFEPVPATAGCIDLGRLPNNLPHVTVIAVGLGMPDMMSTVRLPVTRGMADSTLGPVATRWSVDIAVARFDWLWPRINGGNSVIHGVKIDVQGMELDVLTGMRESLARHRPHLVVELHRGVDRDAVLALLREAGYGPATSIEPADGELTPAFLDDRSYAFEPA